MSHETTGLLDLTQLPLPFRGAEVDVLFPAFLQLSDLYIPGSPEASDIMGSIISILKPDFTWPRQCQAEISEITPPMPRLPGKLMQRICGCFHAMLPHFSLWYCKYFGIPYDNIIVQLPFGLVLKWSERVSLEEVAAMKMARAAGMPVPLVLTCGYHPDYFAPYSILMTRLPGIELLVLDPHLDVEYEQPWLSQLHACISAMRKWKSPYSSRICSVLGTNIHSTRIPYRKMGPFEIEDEMHDFLVSTSGKHGFASMDDFYATLEKANNIRKLPHRVMFTHGDLKPHQILIGRDNQLTGFLDWESGGWYPEYWDFTTAMKFGTGGWWYQVAEWLGGDQYGEELICERALNNLTIDSWVGL